MNGCVFWEPPGGGIEQGETSREAARRELFEETGLDIELEHRSVFVDRDYNWAGRRHVHVEEFFRAEVRVAEIELVRPTDEELATFVDSHFFRREELERLDAPLEPPALASVLLEFESPANGELL